MQGKKSKPDKGYTVPKEGSLGLLAIGDLGLKSWREARGELKPVKEKPVAEDRDSKGGKDIRLRTKGRKT